MKLDDFEIEVHGKFGIIPWKAEKDSVGFDIALPKELGNICMPYNSQRLIDTGIIVKPPIKCFTMIVPRSSSAKKNIRIANTIGIIDPSYSGRNDTLKVMLTRDSKKTVYFETISLPEELHEDPDQWEKYIQKHCDTYEDFVQGIDVVMESKERVHIFVEENDQPMVFEAGERFCQILFIPFYRPDLVEKTLEFFDKEDRGGFGSTGKF